MLPKLITKVIGDKKMGELIDFTKMSLLRDIMEAVGFIRRGPDDFKEITKNSLKLVDNKTKEEENGLSKE